MREREREESETKRRIPFQKDIMCVIYCETVDRDEGRGHANFEFCENAENQQDN